MVKNLLVRKQIYRGGEEIWVGWGGEIVGRNEQGANETLLNIQIVNT